VHPDPGAGAAGALREQRADLLPRGGLARGSHTGRAAWKRRRCTLGPGGVCGAMAGMRLMRWSVGWSGEACEEGVGGRAGGGAEVGEAGEEASVDAVDVGGVAGGGV